MLSVGQAFPLQILHFSAKKLKKTIEIAEKMCYNRVKSIILTS